jgi:chromosome segregation ATPase
MESSFLTIKEAAQFIDKSEVTIRRLLKRLLKNRTNETDRCIVESTEHGKRLYRIEAHFLVNHANLSEGTRQRLLDQLGQSTNQVITDHGVRSQKNNSIDHTSAHLNGTNDHLNSRPDSTPTHMNTKVDHVTTQKTNEQAGDQSPEQGSDRPADQMRNQNASNGSQLLNDVVDELRSQLKVKDDQIERKDKQIESKDKQLEKQDGTIDTLNATIEKLTDGIQQGNFLVASAQERIPLPIDANRGTITPQHEIVETEPESPTDSLSESDADKDDQPKPTKRGFIGRLADKISFSNS